MDTIQFMAMIQGMSIPMMIFMDPFRVRVTLKNEEVPRKLIFNPMHIRAQYNNCKKQKQDTNL